MKNSEAEINHSLLLFYELRRMTTIKGSDNCILYNIIEGKSSIFSDETIRKLSVLMDELELYLKKSKVAKIWSLKLIDERYIRILNEPLLSLLKSMSSDFERLKIEHEFNVDLQIEKIDLDYIVEAIEACC